MKTTRTPPIVVEFVDRIGDYWEVVSIRRRPQFVLKRLQAILGNLENQEYAGLNVTAAITPETVLIEFDCGEHGLAEAYASLFALDLGWQEDHGILAGSRVFVERLQPPRSIADTVIGGGT